MSFAVVIRSIFSLACRQRLVVFAFVFSISLLLNSVNAGEVLWAINCGGDEHTDVHGIHYEADSSDIGVESDHGKSLMIQRVVPQDQILYQTERYHKSTFGYDMPVHRDGEYVVVIKFSEVWFTAPNQKVSNMVNLNFAQINMTSPIK